MSHENILLCGAVHACVLCNVTGVPGWNEEKGGVRQQEERRLLSSRQAKAEKEREEHSVTTGNQLF